jgi:ubiquinone/menaquinone biosynthesis C-methylase UbiE
MTDHFKHIYTHRAADYHRMIVPEDTEANLVPALERVIPLAGKRVLDLGTGTGRFPLLLHGRVGLIVGFDLHADMLREHQRQRAAAAGGWGLLQADMRVLPVPAAAWDVVLAGWAIGHLRGWYANEWQQHISQIVREMHRVAAPGGALIILETLTTGSHTPAPPSAELAQYYDWLETAWGFARQEISTDYGFAGVDEAANHTEFFFGGELVSAIRQNGWSRLPEWTGLWSKRV